MRLLTSILALVAMIFSFGETVVASVCAPGMDMDMGMGMHEMGEMHAEGDGMPAGSHEPERGERDEGDRPCPFGPAAAGCAGVVSFPSRVASDLVPRLCAERAAFSEPTQERLLLANAPFHPPRA